MDIPGGKLFNIYRLSWPPLASIFTLEFVVVTDVNSWEIYLNTNVDHVRLLLEDKPIECVVAQQVEQNTRWWTFCPCLCGYTFYCCVGSFIVGSNRSQDLFVPNCPYLYLTIRQAPNFNSQFAKKHQIKCLKKLIEEVCEICFLNLKKLN